MNFTTDTPLFDVVSATKALIKVDKQVKICLVNDFMLIGQGVCFDVNLRLSTRGSDFNVYANRGYDENTKDTDLLASILNGLIGPRTGVEYVKVQAFKLKVHASRAVTCQSIATIIVDRATRAGYLVEFEDLVNKRRS